MKSLVQPRNKPQELLPLLLLLLFLPSFLPQRKTLFSFLLLQNFSSSSSLNFPARSHYQKQTNTPFLFSRFLSFFFFFNFFTEVPIARTHLQQKHSDNLINSRKTQQRNNRKKNGNFFLLKNEEEKGEEDTLRQREETQDKRHGHKRRGRKKEARKKRALCLKVLTTTHRRHLLINTLATINAAEISIISVGINN